MKLEENSKATLGKHTKHFKINYPYITFLIKYKTVSVKYSPLDTMIADSITKLIDKLQQVQQALANKL